MPGPRSKLTARSGAVGAKAAKPHGEGACGEFHRSIGEARKCVERHNLSRHSFGDFVDGTNLWSGLKYTRKLKNLGFVIGLRNDHAGIRWRLDYDPDKGAHEGLDGGGK